MLSIPVLGGIVGYVINRTGVWMLYRPIQFTGVRVPGLARVARHLPRKLRQVPGIMHGGLGWQGIIPSRAAKMGSIAVDKQIGQVGSPSEFYERFGPDKIAEHIMARSDQDIRELVERTIEGQHPELWHQLSPRARETLYARVRQQLPEVVSDVTEQIGRHIDELLDIKHMVIRRLVDNRELTNKLFHEVGRREFRFIIRFGFVFGFLCGIPTIFLIEAVPEWWLLPVVESVIGYATNWLGIWMIYEPLEPRKLGPFRAQGLFPRRQHDAAKIYGDVIAQDIITLENIGEELMHGPRSDRTRQLIASAMRPAVDRAVGPAGVLVRAAYGSSDYERLRESVATEAVEHTLAPIQEPEFSRQGDQAVRELFTARMREMSPSEFVETLRSATREDEWLLVAHGALFGMAGGLLHYLIFGL
ncbi:MAG: hypothetical protein ACJ76S_12790 [Solirubrobacteraceae bacterium]|jgi:uncharacterized membrane protein YheB (UPF0754 family)